MKQYFSIIFYNLIISIGNYYKNCYGCSLLGGTGQRVNGSFLQTRVPDNIPFPCNVKGHRSKRIPSSVHQLRPGNFIIF